MANLAVSGSGSAITRMMNAVRSGGMQRARSTAVATGHTLRQGGESALVGGLLGAAHVQLPNGLDHKVGAHTVPVDGVVAGLGLVAGIALSDQEFGPDMRNMGAAAMAIFTFRKGAELYAKKVGKVVPALSAHGEDDYGTEIGEDPIVALARRL